MRLKNECVDGLPPSLWAETAQPAPVTTKLNGDLNCDVVVIGGGYTGLSTALHLAEAGVSVSLLDAAEPGWGASGRNGGQVVADFTISPRAVENRLGPALGERFIEYSSRAPDVVFNLIRRHGIQCDAERNGWLKLVHAKGAVPRVKALAAEWQQRGEPVEFLEKAQAASLCGSPIYHGALLDQRCGKIQPLSYARGLARAAISAGARIFSRSPATDIKRHQQHWIAKTPNGDIRASNCIIATNGYTTSPTPKLERSYIDGTSCIVATNPLPDKVLASILPHGHIAADSRRILTYFSIDKSNRLLIGGRGRLHNPAKHRTFQKLERNISRIFPQLTEFTVAYRWFGRIALTSDRLPHLYDPLPSLSVAMGYNGRGIAMSTMFGKLAAERLIHPDRRDCLTTPPLSRIPLHSLRRTWMPGIITYFRLLDMWE